jgi:hypothetical protein
MKNLVFILMAMLSARLYAQRLLNSGWINPNQAPMRKKINSLQDHARKMYPYGTDLSEISLLKDVSATQEMMVDPQNRYATFGKQAAADLEKAISSGASC